MNDIDQPVSEHQIRIVRAEARGVVSSILRQTNYPSASIEDRDRTAGRFLFVAWLASTGRISDREPAP